MIGLANSTVTVIESALVTGEPVDSVVLRLSLSKVMSRLAEAVLLFPARSVTLPSGMEA